MTPEHYESLLYNQRLMIYLMAGVLAFKAALITLTAYLYVRVLKTGQESLDLLRLSRGLQSMTREHTEAATAKLDHVGQDVSDVKSGVNEVRAAISDGTAAAALSGEKLKPVPPGAGGGA